MINSIKYYKKEGLLDIGKKISNVAGNIKKNLLGGKELQLVRSKYGKVLDELDLASEDAEMVNFCENLMMMLSIKGKFVPVANAPKIKKDDKSVLFGEVVGQKGHYEVKLTFYIPKTISKVKNIILPITVDNSMKEEEIMTKLITGLSKQGVDGETIKEIILED